MVRTEGSIIAGYRLAGLLAGLFVLFVGRVQAESHAELRFDRLGLEDGLSQSTIMDIVQDGDGFIWLATEDGLNRFDSYEFQVHRHEPDNPASLAHNFVNALAVDAAGILWVGSRGGLQARDPSLGQFGPVLPDGRGNPMRDVTALTVGPDGDLWVGTQSGGLYRRAAAGGALVSVDLALQSPVRDLLVGPGGLLWVATEHGLTRIDTDTGAPRAPDVTLPAPVLELERHGDGLLVASGGGLYRLAAGEGAVWSIERLIEEPIQSISIDASGGIYAGGGDGVLFRPPGGTWRRWRNDATDPFSLVGDRIVSLFHDSGQVLWIGTSGTGLSLLSPGSRRFNYLAVRSRPGAGLNNSLVWAITRDRHGGLWIGTKGGGVNYRESDHGAFRYFVPAEGANSLSSDWVLAIHEAADGGVWVGTRGGGLNRIDPLSGEVEVFRHQPNDPRSLANDRVYAISEDSDGTLWFGTNAGLSARHLDRDRFETLAGDQSARLRDSSIRALHLTRDGTLWVGTRRGGLHRVVDGAIEPVLPELGDYLILAIHEDDEGTLWAASDHGLVRYQRETGRHQVFRRADGLPNDLVYGILAGEGGDLWLSTNRGLSRFDSETGRFDNYDTGDGLTSNEFNQGAYHRDPDGTLWFGSVEGVTVFHPAELVPDPNPPRLVLTGIRIGSRSATERRAGANDLAAHRRESLTLEPDQRLLTLEFAALNYAAPRQVRYAYRLLGASDDWVNTDSRRRSATYTGLAPGSYRFQLRASNGDGVWTEQPLELAIEVRPPIWRTGAALALYAAVILGILALAYRMRLGRRRMQRAAQRLVAESEERLRLALWGSGDELWDWDLATGEVHRMNEHEQLERPDQERFEGVDHLGSHMHPDDLPQFRERISAYLEGRSGNYEVTYRCRNRAGGWTWVMDRGQVVAFDAHGNPARITGTTKIIDALKRTEEQLRVLNEDLEHRISERTDALTRAYDELSSTQEQLVESEKMASLGNLVAGVAHELNTPLGIGLTAASHLKERVDRLLEEFQDSDLPAPVAEYCRQSQENAELIMTSLDRAANMVRSFKQVAVDQAVEERRPFPLKQYLDQILTSLRPRLRGSAHQVEVSCPEDLVLDSFPGAIYQIVSNLILNSLMHGYPPGVEGTLSIEAKAVDGQLQLVYRDDGQGMDESVRQQIFEPFFTTRRGRGGTGLGMHIVFNLVTQGLGGQIRCKSAPGKGVEFRMSIPGVVGDLEDAARTARGEG